MSYTSEQRNASESSPDPKESSSVRERREINKILQYYRGYVMADSKAGKGVV